MTSAKILILLVLLLLLLFLTLSCRSSQQEWKGTVTEEEGTTVIHNPKVPLYAADIFRIEEKATISSGSESDSEWMFQNIVSLDIDQGGNLYVLDSKAGNIKVFDRSGRPLKIIGKRGQGPGEFGVPQRITLTHQGELCVGEPQRSLIHFLDLDGSYLRKLQTSLPFFEGPKLTSLGEVTASYGILGDKFSFELVRFDRDMKPVVVYASIPILKPPKVHIFVYYAASDLRWDISPQDEIIWGVMTSPEYELFVHSCDGRKLKKIVKDFDPVPLGADEFEALMMKWFGRIPSNPNWDFVIPKHYPPFQGLIVDDQGRIFVKRFERVADSDRHLFEVFDAAGRYITDVILDGGISAALFKEGELYTIEEDEEGFKVVKRYHVTWKI